MPIRQILVSQRLKAFCHIISANERIMDDKVATACGLEEQETEIRSPDKADLHFLQGLQNGPLINGRYVLNFA